MPQQIHKFFQMYSVFIQIKCDNIGFFTEYGLAVIHYQWNHLTNSAQHPYHCHPPSIWAWNRTLAQGALAFEWTPRIKKSCPISGLQLRVWKSVRCKGDMGQKFLVKRWWEGDWWLEEDRLVGMYKGGRGIKQLATFRSTNIESERGDTCSRSALNLLTQPFLNSVGSAPLITNFNKGFPADRGGSRAGQCGPVQLTTRHANNLGQQEGVDCPESKIDLPICTTMFTPCSLAYCFFTALDCTVM